MQQQKMCFASVVRGGFRASTPRPVDSLKFFSVHVAQLEAGLEFMIVMLGDALAEHSN